MTLSPDLPRPDHAERRDRLREALLEQEVPGVVVTSSVNVRWLTGFSGTNGQLLVLPGAVLLVTDDRYEERARSEAPDVDVATERDWAALVVERCADAGLDEVGFESDGLTHAQGEDLAEALDDRGIDAVALRDLVQDLREVKDAAELGLLAAACAITDEAFTALLAHVVPGRTERELRRILLRTMEDLGAEGPAFDPIVAGGPHSAIPHHHAGDRPLARGDLLKIDFGARVEGYHADMTRTVSLGPVADDELGRVHDIVREAQSAGVAAATAGAAVSAVDAACRDVITAAGYGERFLHGTGHGVGLEIHEAPWVSREAAGSLAAGTVITVEPGVYLPGRGGVRIEDTVAVTADGPARRLTTAPRELLRL
ncbi:MAG: aminopeptidase P family protein [Actinobacteria bacterium]|nr:aminopeptidase P family protein [Actinomycetota bacterium]